MLRKWIYLGTLTVPGGARAANQTSQTPLSLKGNLKVKVTGQVSLIPCGWSNLLSMVLGRRQEAEENNSWRVECAPS